MHRLVALIVADTKQVIIMSLYGGLTSPSAKLLAAMHRRGMSDGTYQIFALSGSSDCYITSIVCPLEDEDGTVTTVDDNLDAQHMLRGAFGVMGKAAYDGLAWDAFATGFLAASVAVGTPFVKDRR